MKSEEAPEFDSGVAPSPTRLQSDKHRSRACIHPDAHPKRIERGASAGST
jgi:hypothetical protein